MYIYLKAILKFISKMFLVLRNLTQICPCIVLLRKLGELLEN